MSSSKTVTEAVNRTFGPLELGRTVRNVLINTGFTVLLALAVISLDGWLAWALLGWLIWRALTTIGIRQLTRFDAEKSRRIQAVPEPYRSILLTGRAR